VAAKRAVVGGSASFSRQASAPTQRRKALGVPEAFRPARSRRGVPPQHARRLPIRIPPRGGFAALWQMRPEAQAGTRLGLRPVRLDSRTRHGDSGIRHTGCNGLHSTVQLGRPTNATTVLACTSRIDNRNPVRMWRLAGPKSDPDEHCQRAIGAAGGKPGQCSAHNPQLGAEYSSPWFTDARPR
jgi:hypothetical protein